MPNTFEILNAFLMRFGDEVEGRDAHKLSPETVAQLRSFAGGRLPASEQAKLIHQLSEQPEWTAALAAEVKALRGSNGRKAPE